MMNDMVVFGTIVSWIFAIIAPVAIVTALYHYGKGQNRFKLGILGKTVLLISLLNIGWMLYYASKQSVSHHPTNRQESVDTASQPISDEQLLRMGKNLFSVHCAVCHGEGGDAPKGKGANLTHRISFESALLNIQRGANNFKRTFPGGMPPMISDRLRAAQVAHYVSSGFSENEEGRKLYGMINCARCHGEDGRGLEYLGPNIREFDERTVALVLKNGKNGVIGKMPSFEQLSQKQVEALSRYVITLKAAP